MNHLTRADYQDMPWANGRGQTIQMLRRDGPDGLLVRLSMATVAEDGAFSIFPGIDRNLTVIDGPGFDLVGDVALRADPLRPVAFAGDATVAASGVTGVSIDFNVMTARSLPPPEVKVLMPGAARAVRGKTGGMLCLFALEPATVQGVAMARHDLLVNAPAPDGCTGRLLAIRLFGLT